MENKLSLRADTSVTSILISLVNFFFFFSTAWGSDFHSARTDALGGAGHAAPILNDSLYLNPSYVSYNPYASFSFNYLNFGGGTITTPGGESNYYGHDLNASIQDGAPNSLFQAGVGYTIRDDASLVHLGASKNIIKEVGVGIGAKFIFPTNGNPWFSDGTFSVTGIPAGWFQASLIIDNILETAANLGFIREYILGTKFTIMNIVYIYLDPHLAFNLPNGLMPFGYEAGIEFPFFTDFFLRAGQFENAQIPYQNQRGNGFGVGIGWIAPKISVEYGFSRSFGPIAAFSHNAGVTVYF